MNEGKLYKNWNCNENHNENDYNLDHNQQADRAGMLHFIAAHKFKLSLQA